MAACLTTLGSRNSASRSLAVLHLLLLFLLQTPHEVVGSLLWGLDFCSKEAWTEACLVTHEKGAHFNSRKDLYCSSSFQATRDLILSYCAKHKRVIEDPSPDDKFVIAHYDRLFGWGNRLPGVISTLLIAMAYNRTMLLDFDDYYEYFDPPLDLHISSYKNQAALQSSSKCLEPCDYTIREGHLTSITANWTQLYSNYTVWEVQDHWDYIGVPFSANPNHRGWVSEHFPTWEIYWPLAHLLYRPKQELRDKVLQFRTAHGLDKAITVGIQVRTLKNVGTTFNKSVMLPRFFHLAQAVALQRGVQARDIKFFITSDAADVYQAAKVALGADRVVYSDAARLTNVSTDGGNPGTEASGLFDMLLLSQSHEIVVTVSSSYAGSAHALGGVHAYYVSTAAKPLSQSPSYWRQTHSDPCYFEATYVRWYQRLSEAARTEWQQHPHHEQHEMCHRALVGWSELGRNDDWMTGLERQQLRWEEEEEERQRQQQAGRRAAAAAAGHSSGSGSSGGDPAAALGRRAVTKMQRQ